MLFEDTYRTLAETTTGEYRDRGSKFLAFAYPIENEEQTKDLLAALRKAHPKANHHCYAFRLGLDRNQFRANDDGEPSGSAGKPILNTLYSHDLTNVLVVVIRYFGGTLLGVPGLINAYKTATYEAIVGAKIVEKTVNDVYRLDFAFELMNELMKIVKAFGLKIRQQTFDNDCSMEIEIRKSLLNQVVGKLEKIEGLTSTYLQTI